MAQAARNRSRSAQCAGTRPHVSEFSGGSEPSQTSTAGASAQSSRTVSSDCGMLALPMSSPSEPPDTQSEPPSARRQRSANQSRPLWIAAALVMVMIGAVALAWSSCEPNDAVPTRAPVPSALTEASAGNAQDASDQTDAASPAPSADAAPSSSADAAPRKKKRKKVRNIFLPKKSGRKLPDCNPPHFFDKNGIRHVKPECL